MARRTASLKARRVPVQARSEHTVAAIFEATIQVLLRDGLERLTTTRVADRAGVSVGSLYQYYPNKEVLLAAVLEQHLTTVVRKVEQACESACGEPLERMAAAVVEAFLNAKLARVDVSRALYKVPSDLGRDNTVNAATERARRAVECLLATHPALVRVDLKPISFVFTTSLIGPVQTLVASDTAGPEFIENVRTQLHHWAVHYLKGVAGA